MPGRVQQAPVLRSRSGGLSHTYQSTSGRKRYKAERESIRADVKTCPETTCLDQQLNSGELLFLGAHARNVSVEVL